ncbi:MAG TPA: cytochrome c biogenesis protein CcdA, partial [Corynebacterium amycolatum]|nr:cytochrome c biogenesis protein CcdA [Corynebacterium amycolatum]
MVLGLLAAALAGLVSFASPCVIPLVPGYVSYLTGISGASGAQGNGVTTGVADATSVDKQDGDGDRGQRSSTARVGLAALLFVLGFTVIFVLGSASIFGLVSTL